MHAIEIEATVTSFKRGTASVDIQVFTPSINGSPRQIYALMKVCTDMENLSVRVNCNRQEAPWRRERAGPGKASIPYGSW